MYRLGNGFIVPVEPIFRCLVVVGADHQQPIRPAALRRLAERYGMGGVIGAGPGEKGHVLRNGLPGNPEKLCFFAIGQSCRFAGGSADHERIDSRLFLAANQLPQHGGIECFARKTV